MDSKRTSKLEALLKVANTKKQAGTKISTVELLQFAKSRQEKMASAPTPPSLYCRLVAGMRKAAGDQETNKKESPKAETSKPESSESESAKSESPKSAPAKPAAMAQKPTAPKPMASSPPATANHGGSPGFDWQSMLKTLQPYAAPAAVGTGIGALGALMLPQGTMPGESAQQYQRRQRSRVIGGGLAGGISATALLAAYNAYKARKSTAGAGIQ